MIVWDALEDVNAFWILPWLILAFGLISMLAFLSSLRKPSGQTLSRLFAVLFTSLIYYFLHIYVENERREINSAFKSGNYEVVSGIIQFARIKGRKQQFSVGDVKFQFSTSANKPGEFKNKCGKIGCSIENGVSVKIYYLDDRILRIEKIA